LKERFKMADVQFTQEQQAFVDKLVGDARVSARDKATADADAQRIKDEEKANRANLAAKEEWEKLAQTHEARVKELEPIAEQVQVYLDFIDGVLQDNIKKLGKNAKSAVAGLPEGMTPMEKLTWLNANETLFEVSGGDGVGTPARSKDRLKRGKLERHEMTRIPLVP
jgi:hypothetical protein